MTKNNFAVGNFLKPYLGRECEVCNIPIDTRSRHCTLCKRHYPLTKFDFDKDRCEHCGTYEVTMNDNFQFWCDQCHIWIESTNEGNGPDYGDCRKCGDGFKKDQGDWEDTCFWCQ